MLVKVYGDAAVSRETVWTFSWWCWIGWRRTTLRSSVDVKKKLSKINENIGADRRLTTREISNALNIPFGSVYHILIKNLKMRQGTEKFFPGLLSQEQKELRVSTWLELLDRSNSDSFFFYEVWSLEMNFGCAVTILKRKCRVLTQIARSKRALRSKWNVKIMLIAFIDIEGIVRSEFMPRGTTVHSEYHKSLLRSDAQRDATLLHRETLRGTHILSSPTFWLVKKMVCVSSTIFPKIDIPGFLVIPKI
jgi:hypothetical protein